LRALKALKMLAYSAKLVASLIPATSSLLILYLKYLYKKHAARRAAQKIMKRYGMSEKAAEDLVDVLVPDIGGLKEWVTSMRSESYY